VIPIKFISTHRSDAGHVDPLRAAAQQDQRFQVTDGNRGIVFVQGDRTELLGEIMSAVADNAVIAHAAGGERTLGSTDDRVRDALTKLAHLHYPVHQEAKRRLILLGEEEWRVCVSGEVGVDTIKKMGDADLPPGADAACPGDVVIAVHPSTSAENEMPLTLEAAFVMAQRFARAWLVAPNGDPGSPTIDKLWSCIPNGKRLPPLTHHQFLTLIKRVGVLIGNTSSIITEAPHLGVFTILLGSRQAGRIPAPSDGMACQHILDHMAHCWQNPALRSKA
jgi:UDP-hydrolysing UDP-N-acetyl-D-glucosamine 2-epimerase